MEKINRSALFFFSLLLILGILFQKNVFATCAGDQSTCSSSYGVGEYNFGSGGSLDTTCSASYCAAQTLGETGVGVTNSADYQAYPGFEVNREPSLQFLVNTTSVNLGTLTTTTTATQTATFSVESYLSSGYIIETVSPPPNHGSHILSAPSTPTASAVGTEQFGINLVNNLTSCTPPAPANFGANPVQVPSSSYSYGVASANYAHCGEFLYNSGDTIASSSQSSGQTNYTISYIANISSVTPAGTYNMNQALVAVPTF
ncbi:MAG: hypothetical protein ACREF7_02010 [Candidatus Saccharimonadales bacterium]